MKTVINIILLLVIGALSYFLYESIAKPIRFDKAKEIRYKAAIQRLKDIRTAEVAYLAVNGKFTGDFDTLINFIKHDSIPVVKAIGSVPDTLSEKEALEMGIIYRDTIKVSTLDSLYDPGFTPDSLRYVPFTNGAEFELGATILEIGSKVSSTTLKVPVFEAKVPNKVLLKGLDNQLRINLDDEMEKMGKYPGLKVGSLEENINNAGNWE